MLDAIQPLALHLSLYLTPTTSPHSPLPPPFHLARLALQLSLCLSVSRSIVLLLGLVIWVEFEEGADGEGVE